jgi:uncharacterized protein
LVPSAVLHEIRQKSDPAVAVIEAALRSHLLEECPDRDPTVLAQLPGLGSGESEVIAQALGRQISSVVLDDMDARRTARSVGLQPIGTVGLLLAAKKRGLLPSVQFELQRLKDMGFWISQSLWEQALQEAGES